MYSKLAFRNIRRSLRDYIIYFVTLTLTAALMYSFLALGLSPDILAMTENMKVVKSSMQTPPSCWKESTAYSLYLIQMEMSMEQEG